MARLRDPLWYKDAMVYETHVRAFFDSNNDGIGDFPGLIAEARLPAGPGHHVPVAPALLPLSAQRTMATTSPITGTSTRMYGTLDDFRRLVAAAHERDIAGARSSW